MFTLLDTVVLTRDLAEHSLRAGDLGAVVDVLDGTHFMVEFVRASGATQALVTIGSDHLRALGDADLLAVRSVCAAA
jgi:hypothetical protein